MRLDFPNCFNQLISSEIELVKNALILKYEKIKEYKLKNTEAEPENSQDSELTYSQKRTLTDRFRKASKNDNSSNPDSKNVGKALRTLKTLKA